MNVTPAILPHSFEEVQEKLSRVEGLAHRVQIDLCDGIVGREKTWLPEGKESLPASFSYEFDLMVREWKLYAMRAIEIGATRVVAHVDGFTDENIEELVGIVSVRSVELGISISNDQEIGVHADMIRKAKNLYSKVFVQVMGIAKIGEQGQIFDDAAVERVRALKREFGDMSIQVDGGMTTDTAQKVTNAGAETAVVGSFIFGDRDPAEAIRDISLIAPVDSV